MICLSFALPLNMLLQAVGSFFQRFTKEAVEKFLLTYKLWYATVGPDNLSVIPFNHVVYEKVSRQCDASGLKCGFYLKLGEDSHESVNKWLNASSAANCSLQDAVDAM